MKFPFFSNSVTSKFTLFSYAFSLKMDFERATQEKVELHRIYMAYYEFTTGLHIELQKQVELLLAIISVD